MSEKHYTISYLEHTQQLMKELKQQSYTPFSLQEQGTIADIGCGMGMDVITLAELYAKPGLQWVGVDHDLQMIDKASALAAGRNNIRFVQAEVTELPFESGSLSGIRAERLLQHIATPEQVYAEVKRCLKPGHPFVVVETDWPSICFYNTDATTAQRIADFYALSKVKNGLAARKLYVELLQHGFKDINLKVIPLVTPSYEAAKTYLWIDKMVAEMQAAGLLNKEEASALLQRFEAADQAGHFATCMNMVMITCTL